MTFADRLRQFNWAQNMTKNWDITMSDFQSGERPRASSTTMINFTVMIATVIGIVIGSTAAIVSITGAIGSIKGDVMVLQNQMQDVRMDVREIAKAVRDAQGKR